MERFRLMNVYVIVVLLLLGVGIVTLSSRRSTQAAAVSNQADLVTDEKATKSAGDIPLMQGKSTTQATVAIDNFKFTPRELTVAIGGIVTWVNHDDVPHTASSKDEPAPFDSKTLDTDDKYSFTFTRPGTYSYYCKVHPHMTGTIIVR